MTINSGLTDSELVAAVQKAHGTNVVYDNGDAGATHIIDAGNGVRQRVRLVQNTALAVAFLPFHPVGTYLFYIVQDDTGGHVLNLQGLAASGWGDSATADPINTEPNGVSLLLVDWDGVRATQSIVRRGVGA